MIKQGKGPFWWYYLKRTFSYSTPHIQVAINAYYYHHFWSTKHELHPHAMLTRSKEEIFASEICTRCSESHTSGDATKKRTQTFKSYQINCIPVSHLWLLEVFIACKVSVCVLTMSTCWKRIHKTFIFVMCVKA